MSLPENITSQAIEEIKAHRLSETPESLINKIIESVEMYKDHEVIAQELNVSNALVFKIQEELKHQNKSHI